MKFSGQKFFILLGIFLIPILFVGALLREPIVNRGLLRITLSFLKKRVGASMKAQTWKVDLSKFAVAVEGIEFTHDKLVITAKELRAEFSPIFLLIGRVYLSRVWADEVNVSGEVTLTKKQQKEEKPFHLEKALSEAADEVIKVQKLMDEKKIGFELFEVSSIKVNTNLVTVVNGDMNIENFGTGHVKAELDLEEINGGAKIPAIEKFQSSIVLYKDRSNAYLSIRRLNAELQNKGSLHTTLEVKGRIPGDVSVDFVSDLSGLKKWMKVQSVPVLKEFANEHNFNGYVEVRGTGQLAGAGLKQASLTVRGRSLEWNDMSMAQLDSTVDVKDKEWKVSKVHGVFNGTRLDKAMKNEFNGEDLVFENEKISGNIKIERMGLCALLRGVGVKDCQLDLVMKGDVNLAGTLKPLKIIPHIEIDTEPFQVWTEADFADTPASGRLLKAKASHVTGVLDINDEEVIFTEARAKFSDAAAIEAHGGIKIKPTRVYLKVSTEKAKIEDMIEDFKTLTPGGLIKAEVTVDYDNRRLKEAGRTDFFADYLVRGLNLQGLPLGDASGKLQFTKRILEFRPTVRNGPGTLKVIGQIGRLDPTLNESMMSIYGEASDYEILVPGSHGSPIFDGIFNFKTNLHGSTADNSIRPFGGNLKADLHSMVSFGIPFDRGDLSAFVDLKGLRIEKLTAYKGVVKTELTGFIGPNKASKINFSSNYVPVRQLGYVPEYERLAQSGTVKASGWWDQSKGWNVEVQCKDLKMSSNTYPTLNLKFEGGKDNEFFADIDSDDEIKIRYDSKEKSFIGRLKDSGIVLALSLINKWERVPEFLKVKGDMDISWGATLGKIDLNALDIQVTDKWNAEDKQLIKLESPARILYQDGNFKGNASFASGLGHFDIKSAGAELLADGKLSMRLFDLLLPDFIRFVQGTSLVDVKWNPKIANSLVATAAIQDTTAFLPALGAELRGVTGHVKYNNGKISLEAFQGSSGDAGDFTFAGDLSSDATNMNLKTHLDSVNMRIGRDVELLVTGDFDITGKEKPFMLRGKARIEKGLLRKEFSGSSIKTSILEKPFVNFNIPFEVLPGFEVKNTLTDAFVSGKGSLLGNNLSPIISGRFDVVKGTLLAKDNEFAINFARVDLPLDPDFTPLNVNVQASTVKNFQGLDYRIFLSAEGDPNDLKLDFRSEPSLTQRELISLLTLGYIPQDQPTTTGTSQGGTVAQSASAEAFQLLFGQALGRGIQKQTGFDVRVGTSANLKQDDTIPKVSVYRKLGDRVSATFGRSLDVARPENNFKIDYRLLKNLNLTGVWENPEENRHSLGLDLRLEFEIK